MSIEKVYKNLHTELAQICREHGRNPEQVRVMAVSKTVGLEQVERARQAGFHLFGENRVEELERKQAAFPDEQWHFIGNVQSRKIPRIVACADLIHSVYQQHHLDALDKAARQKKKIQAILIEVNISGEESKGGVTPENLGSLIEYLATLESVQVNGLMTMAPRGDSRQAQRCFEDLAALFRQVKASLPASQQDSFNELSMGMSEDWREAVAAGATIVRIGRMIFTEDYS